MRARALIALLAAALAVAIAVALPGCAKPAAKKAPAAGETATARATPVSVVKAELGSIAEGVELTGTVEPQRETDVQAEVSGKVAWVGVEVGDTVRRGQALVRLDTALASAAAQQSLAAVRAAQARYGQSRVGLHLTDAQTASQLRQAESSMEAARNRLRQAKTAADLTRRRVEDAIEQARIGVSSAQAQLADVRAGARSQEINQAQARVDQARSALKLSATNLSRMQSLVKSGAVAQAQLDAAQTEYENAQGNVRVAEQALDLAKEGARSEQVRLAELSVSQARQAQAQAESQRGQIEVAERDVRAAEVAVEQAEESVRLSRAQRAQIAAGEQEVRAARAAVGQASAANLQTRTQVYKHVVYAPIGGVVAARNVDPGEGAMPGVSLVRIVNLNPVRVACEASELQVARLRVGQQADVAVDALQGRRFAGVIADLAPQSREGERIYIVRVDVPNPARLLKAGMFARIRIVTGRSDHAVLVPRDVLIEQADKRVVYMVAQGKIAVREVELGAVEDSRVQITRGVRQGDLLVYGGQSLLADGQSVEPQLREQLGVGAEAQPATK